MASSHPTTSSHENGKSRKRARNQQQQQQKLQHQPWVPDFPYNADYNDHFETPLRAYEDISPLLDWLVDDIGNKKKTVKSRKDHVIYDPYYCNGQTTTLFRSLGFEGIINRKRDFYEDIAQNNLPKNFQTLVTNPPYSDQHKEKCLDFAFAQLREHKKPVRIVFYLLYILCRSETHLISHSVTKKMCTSMTVFSTNAKLCGITRILSNAGTR